jgi:nucleotide-binding universal stress UspA family protein
MSAAASAPEPIRGGRDRPRKFLVVVDKTPECGVAVRFATRRAQHTGGRVTLFCVAQHDDFQQWRGVEEIMKDEAHQEAENLIYEAAKAVNELSGIIPELVILEGPVSDCLAKLIKEDRDISILVLAAGTSKEGPGPLISAFVNRAGANPIPVTIVPGGLSDDEIDSLA